MDREFKQLPEHPAYWISNHGEVVNKEHRRYLVPETVHGGYERIRICGDRYYIHKLVAKLFVPNTDNKKYVIHLDGNHSNNQMDNLAWSDGYKSIL